VDYRQQEAEGRESQQKKQKNVFVFIKKSGYSLHGKGFIFINGKGMKNEVKSFLKLSFVCI